MAVILKTEYPGGVSIAVWKVTETMDELLKQTHLSAAEEESFNTSKNEARKKEWLAVRALLQQLRPARPVIKYKENGKPYLSGSPEGISISHSGQYIAIALGKQAQTGVDIEQIHPKIKRIAERFVNEKEKVFLKESILLEQLCLIWCAKEVLYKMHPAGMLNFKSNLFVSPFDVTEKGEIEGHIIENSTDKLYMLAYQKIDNYMLVYALKSQE